MPDNGYPPIYGSGRVDVAPHVCGLPVPAKVREVICFPEMLATDSRN